MASKFLLVCLLLEILFCEFAHALWWSLGNRAVMDHARICRKKGSRLSKDPQSTICRKEPMTFKMILEGSHLAMKECQYQFRNHQWNCTDNRRSLKKILMKDTPETAFLNAIMSAGVTHEVTAACSRGDLLQCSCSRDSLESPPAEATWREKKKRLKSDRRKGQSGKPKDDTRRRKGRRRGERRRGRQGKGRRGGRERRGPGRGRRRDDWMDNAINTSFAGPDRRTEPQDPPPDGGPLETAGAVTTSVGAAGEGSPSEGEWNWSGCDDNVGFGYRIARDFMDWRYLRGRGSQDIRSIVMLHNNEVGRLAVQRYLQPHCKCHGLSGSCTHRTCWKRLPTFRSIGARLKEQFSRAIKVTASNDGTSISPVGKFSVTEEDLIYLEDSPDFCSQNKRTGSLGTEGRVCNVTASDTSGCDFMCCGRGARHEELELEENCKCRFKFCCEVTCQKCRIRKRVSYCL